MMVFNRNLLFQGSSFKGISFSRVLPFFGHQNFPALCERQGSGPRVEAPLLLPHWFHPQQESLVVSFAPKKNAFWKGGNTAGQRGIFVGFFKTRGVFGRVS